MGNEKLDLIETTNEEDVKTDKPKKAKVEKPKTKEDKIVEILVTKPMVVGGKYAKVHDVVKVPQSELDKLPDNSYRVRK